MIRPSRLNSSFSERGKSDARYLHSIRSDEGESRLMDVNDQ